MRFCGKGYETGFNKSGMKSVVKRRRTQRDSARVEIQEMAFLL